MSLPGSCEQTLTDQKRCWTAPTLTPCAGRTAEAIALHEQNLTDQERTLGGDHPTPWPRGTISPSPTGRRA